MVTTRNPRYWLEKKAHRKTGYPEATIAYCPQCPFWAHVDRWTGERID